MDVRSHLRVIWHYRLPVVALSLLVAGAVFLIFSSRPDVFVDTARLQVVVDPDADNPRDRSGFLAFNYVELAGTTPVLAAAVDRSDVDSSLEDLDAATSATADPDTGFVGLTAEGDTAAKATVRVAALASALVEAVDDRAQAQRDAELAPLDARIVALRAELAALPAENPDRDVLVAELSSVLGARAAVSAQPLDGLELVDPPGRDVGAQSSGAVSLAITALLVALILNSELAVGLHLLSDRVLLDDADEVRSITGLPVLATIDRGDRGDPREVYRSLRTTLREHGVGVPVRLAVVGPGGGSLRSDVSVGIAQAFADLGTPALLVDGDLREPSLHERFGLDRSPGVGELATGTTSAAEHLRTIVAEPDLRLLTAGTPVADPGGVVSVPLPVALHALEGHDVAVVDTPDATRWNDGIALAAACDVSVVVLGPDIRRRSTRALIRRFEAADGNPIGVIVVSGG